MEDIKTRIAEIDSVVLQKLLYASQFALNDVSVIKMVSKEIGVTETEIEALAPIAIDLSTGSSSQIKTIEDLNRLIKKMDSFKLEFESE